MNEKFDTVQQQFSNLENMMAKITTLCSDLTEIKKKEKKRRITSKQIQRMAS